MKKVIEMKKKVKGFTLVELIVVIAIIGVLASILVPSMMGFVRKSKYATANANAKEIFNSLKVSATNAYVATGRTNCPEAAKGQTISKQYLRDTYNKLDDAQKAEMSVDLNGYFGVVYDSEGYPTMVAWAKSNNDNEIVGRYPNPTSLDEPANWNTWTDKS